MFQSSKFKKKADKIVKVREVYTPDLFNQKEKENVNGQNTPELSFGSLSLHRASSMQVNNQKNISRFGSRNEQFKLSFHSPNQSPEISNRLQINSANIVDNSNFFDFNSSKMIEENYDDELMINEADEKQSVVLSKAISTISLASSYFAEDGIALPQCDKEAILTQKVQNIRSSILAKVLRTPRFTGIMESEESTSESSLELELDKDYYQEITKEEKHQILLPAREGHPKSCAPAQTMLNLFSGKRQQSSNKHALGLPTQANPERARSEDGFSQHEMNFIGSEVQLQGKEIIVVDCRYSLEHVGGSILGAVNLNSPSMLKYLIKDSPGSLFNKNIVNAIRGLSGRKIELNDLKNIVEAEYKRQEFSSDIESIFCVPVLVFHCEYSQKRGPKLLGFFRKMDREMSMEHWPNVQYPEVYLLKGGYKEFVETHGDLCWPPFGYIREDNSNIVEKNEIDEDYLLCGVSDAKSKKHGKSRRR